MPSQYFESDYYIRQVYPSTVRRHGTIGAHWMDFYKIWYVSIFLKDIEKIQVSLKQNKNNGNLHE